MKSNLHCVMISTNYWYKTILCRYSYFIIQRIIHNRNHIIINADWMMHSYYDYISWILSYNCDYNFIHTLFHYLYRRILFNAYDVSKHSSSIYSKSIQRMKLKLRYSLNYTLRYHLDVKFAKLHLFEKSVYAATNLKNSLIQLDTSVLFYKCCKHLFRYLYMYKNKISPVRTFFND